MKNPIFKNLLPAGLEVCGQKKNTENVERLISLGKMEPSGLAEIEKAKADGRWDKAYDSPANVQIPKDFLQELEKKPRTIIDVKEHSKLTPEEFTIALGTLKRQQAITITNGKLDLTPDSEHTCFAITLPNDPTKAPQETPPAA